MSDIVTRVAVILANINYIGVSSEDWDLWSEDVDSEEQALLLDYAWDIVKLVEDQ